MMLTKKLSIATLKWFLVVFAVPAIMAGFAFYEFYISAPLTYADKATVGAIENRVLKVEEGIKHLPTAMQMKDIVKEAIKESKVP